MSESAPQVLAIILARGGSKGLPRKNVLPLAGKPLVAHAIGAALEAQRITRVVVSTDDDEIAAVSRRFGAEVVIRPAELANDGASSESGVVHVLETLAAREGYAPDFAMLIQCTSPLTTSADLDGLVAEVTTSGADSGFTAVPFFHFLWKRGAEGAEGINHGGKKRQRRQDMEPQFLENGAAYLFRTPLFLQTSERFCGRLVMHVVDAERCLEIDTREDMDRAEAVMALQRPKHAGGLPFRPRALIMDFDGVLTDNRVLVDQDGREAVFCSRGDGMGLELLRRQTDVATLILSKERNPVVMRRAEKLKIPCLHAVDDKPAALTAWLAERGISPSEAIYIGNDVNDVEVMQLVGFAVCPADSHASAMAVAHLVLQSDGGQGAVRELCDLILEHHA
jgi:YrbI family 3-deoxy-D-manno-octulosonate 8-phosphate phosphatase